MREKAEYFSDQLMSADALTALKAFITSEKYMQSQAHVCLPAIWQGTIACAAKTGGMDYYRGSESRR